MDNETQSEKTTTKRNTYTNRFVHPKSSSASRYDSTKKFSFSRDEGKNVSVGRNLITNILSLRRNLSLGHRQVPGNISNNVTPESLLQEHNGKN